MIPATTPNLSLAHERFGIDARTIAPAELHPIRALMCGFNLNWEGAAQSQYEMTIRLKERGVIDPVVYAPEDGPLRGAYEERGIQVEVGQHPLAGIFRLATYERAIAGFAERVEEWRAELVYGNTLPTFYAIDTARHLGLPSIWNPRESEPWRTYFGYLAPDIAARALQCFAHPYKVVFVANATREGCLPLNTHHNFVTIHKRARSRALRVRLAPLAPGGRARARAPRPVGRSAHAPAPRHRLRAQGPA